MTLATGCKGGDKDKASPPTNPPDELSTPKQPDTPKTPDTSATTPGAENPGTRPAPGLEADPGDHTGKHLWSTRLGSMDKDSVRGVAIDAKGNVAVSGFYSTGADFGDGKAVEAQQVDAYVAKYSPEGKLLWVAHFGGKGEDVGNGVAFDPSGNVLAVGLFSGEMQIGSTKLVGQGSDDAFIAKFDAGGTPIWARHFGGLDSDAAHSVASLADGTMVITGSFKGSFQAAEQELKSKGNEDIFLLCLDAQGGLLWIHQFGERWQDFGQQVVVDSQDNIILFGEFTGEMSFGGPMLKAEGNQDLFLVKLDPGGKHIWSRRFGSPFNELGLGAAVDPAGNIAITGSFDHEISFGGDKLASQGESDVFVAKFDAGGKHLWSRSYGGAREDIGYAIGTDKYGNVAVGGWFWQSVDFGSGKPLQAKGLNKDAFLLKLSAAGEHLWSLRFGDHDHDQIRGLAMNADGLVAAAGVFRFAIEMGGQALESARKPEDKAPPADVFVAVFGR